MKKKRTGSALLQYRKQIPASGQIRCNRYDCGRRGGIRTLLKGTNLPAEFLLSHARDARAGAGCKVLS